MDIFLEIHYYEMDILTQFTCSISSANFEIYGYAYIRIQNERVIIRQMVQSYSMYFLYYKPPHTRFECLKGIAKLQCGHNSCIEHSFNQECLRIFR